MGMHQHIEMATERMTALYELTKGFTPSGQSTTTTGRYFASKNRQHPEESDWEVLVRVSKINRDWWDLVPRGVRNAVVQELEYAVDRESRLRDIPGMALSNPELWEGLFADGWLGDRLDQ